MPCLIALIVPAARDSLKVCLVIIVAVAVTCILKYVPVFAFVSSGFRIIIATVAAAALGACFSQSRRRTERLLAKMRS